jgi:hypothetical protein
VLTCIAGLRVHLAKFSSSNTSYEVVPFGVCKFHDILILADSDALVGNFYRWTASACGAQGDSSRFHLLHLLSKPCYTLNYGLRSRSSQMLTIGKVAQRVGIRPSAIRYYERQGMVQPTVR